MTYKSTELFKKILSEYKFVDKSTLKTATENQLMALSGQTQDNIFIQYGIARRLDEQEKKKRRNDFLGRKFFNS